MNSDHTTLHSDKPVLLIGSACVDILGRSLSELSTGSSTPGMIRSSFGGVARNVAENLARLGQETILLTAVGADQLGDQLLQQAREAGVNVDYALRSAEHPTGFYLGVINSLGELQFALDDLRALSAITPDYVRQHAELFKAASFVFIDANLSPETIRTVVSLARRADLKMVADPTSTLLATKLKPYLADMYLVNPNMAEAAVFCDPDCPISNRRQALAAAKQLVTRGVEVVIVTMAAAGLCYATSATSGHIPAIRTEILDPTGAGDAMTATALFALINGIPLDDAVCLGVSAASLTLRYQGAVVPDLSLEKLYDALVI